jgi:hypothetical protein
LGIGGPNVYTRMEALEIMFNILKMPPHLIHCPRWIAETFLTYGVNWKHFNIEEIRKDSIDLVVGQGARKIDELYVNPVSFHHGVEEQLYRHSLAWPVHPEEDER